MGAYKQFMCYVLVPSTTRPGKTDKLPVSPYTGAVVNAHDSAHWTTADHACATAATLGPSYGVAFVFTAHDPFFFIDIDGCFDEATGQWSPIALWLLERFAGAAVEVSQSGKGLHIFGTGVAPPHGMKNQAYGLEFYTELRFVALTGRHTQGNAATEHSGALQLITEHLFPYTPGMNAAGGFDLSTAPVETWRGPVDDDDLIRRALQSRSAANTFGNKASFADLWTANHDVLGVAYPDSERAYDASSADAALIAHLAFWTGRHGERIERLMRRSALVRDKWNRDDYLPRSIAAVLSAPGDVLTDKLPEPPAGTVAALGAPIQADITGATFLGLQEQRDLFAGCVYIQSRHQILVPGGHLLNQDRFRVAYGGYVFSMDAINERTTRNAWEAFTESQALRAPRADAVYFAPARPPGEIVNDAGRTKANIWWPAKVRRTVGEVSPFLWHLEKMLPDERDRAILLSYMAACVQHQGHKFQWAPVIQGAEGNGKSTLLACVASAVGQHYTHWPKAIDLASPFNGWIANKTFVALEELKSREAARNEEILENLHVYITGGTGIQVQHKGVDQETAAICANFMCTTNHRNAIRKTVDNARRFGLFFMAQQTRADIEACGMGGDYFPRLYSWLRDQDGFAIVSELLHTYPIASEFNPAYGMHRAPETSSTGAALRDSLGSVEQQIAEAIAQDTPGFMGGWVSSIQLDRLISDTLRQGNKISLNKRREMLTTMGYILHPGLVDGRVNNPVQPDGKKPQLYVKAGSPQAAIRGPAEIAKAYSAAQQIQPFQVPS